MGWTNTSLRTSPRASACPRWQGHNGLARMLQSKPAQCSLIVSTLWFAPLSDTHMDLEGANKQYSLNGKFLCLFKTVFISPQVTGPPPFMVQSSGSLPSSIPAKSIDSKVVSQSSSTGNPSSGLSNLGIGMDNLPKIVDPMLSICWDVAQNLENTLGPKIQTIMNNLTSSPETHQGNFEGLILIVHRIHCLGCFFEIPNLFSKLEGIRIETVFWWGQDTKPGFL